MAARKSMMGKKRKKGSSSTKEPASEAVFFDEELDPVEVDMVPAEQLTLTGPELEEEFTKTLTSLDPNKAAKITHFNFKNGAFESRPNDKHMAFHVAEEGVIWSVAEKMERDRIRRELEKANKEDEKESVEPDADADGADGDAEAQDGAEPADGDEDDKKEEDADGGDGDGDGDDDEEEDEETAPKILVKNQFNFSDRASQTFNEPQRDRSVQTEPAPKSVFSQNASASAIRDEYFKNLLKAKRAAMAEEDSKRKKSGFGGGGKDDDERDSGPSMKGRRGGKGGEHRIKHHDEGDALLHSAEMLRALKIMERVTVLNGAAASYHHFRYWRSGDMKRGSFLQRLWTFRHSEDHGAGAAPDAVTTQSGNTQSGTMGDPSGSNQGGSAGGGGAFGRSLGSTVTALEWNKIYLDLFAVGYGSYSFHEQRAGRLCVFSLKSTAYPEKVIWCESGVMAMAFHPEEQYSSLLAVGHYDGSVAVYDVRRRDDSPIYSSESPETHHADPVWAVQWVPASHRGDGMKGLSDHLLFYSISSDSELKLWRLSHNELSCETLQTLQTEDQLPALCSCLDVEPRSMKQWLIGTEDGHILTMGTGMGTNTDAVGQNQSICHSAHSMNVYAVKWNRFHHDVFLSASEDWTLKLWETGDSALGADHAESDKPQTANGLEPSNQHHLVTTFDLGCAVEDVEWAPFSSTIFAAVTADGKIHIFDLALNRNGPVVSESVSSSNSNSTPSKLTALRFAVGFPLLIVADDNGHIFALKLSPNLWLDPVRHKEVLKQPGPNMFDDTEFVDGQRQRLENVLKVTGTKVFDVITHFSPKPNAKKKKVRRGKSRFTSPSAGKGAAKLVNRGKPTTLVAAK